jgi:putative ABC transport system ATP-binding protein
MDASCVLASESVSLVYRDGDRETYALRDVSISIPEHRFVGIMGPSGSGKSSLLYILSGLKQPSHGDVILRDFRYGSHSEADLVDLRRTKFGFVFQQPYLITWQTAFENVLMGSSVINAASERKARDFFEQLGIGRLADKMPSQLSGGEKQRVCVARAMMNDPEVIFADEPTASLDHANGHLVVDLLSAYRDRGTVVVVTHDPEMLADADSVLLMRDGEQMGWQSPAEILASGPQKTVKL